MPKFTDAEIDAEYVRELDEVARLLPAWFVPRMCGDEWFFGLLVTGGFVLAISHLNDVRRGADGSIWLDVEMIDDIDFIAEN
jgi:hypothetical protein